MRSENTKSLVRLVAAVYLGYLGIKLFNKEAFETSWICPAVGAVFLIVALLIAYKTIKDFLKKGQVNLNELNENAEEAESDDTASEIEEESEENDSEAEIMEEIEDEESEDA